ncbi:hypothetical protein DMENIID0001_160640 [Sergentomyia squamirostris]
MDRYDKLERDEDAKIPFYKKRRYHVVLLITIGLFNLLGLRICLSVAVVVMRQKVNVTSEDGSVVEQQEFDWDSKELGIILSSFYYGYIATQIIGGILATRFGGHLVFGIGVGATAALTLLLPIAAKTHLALLYTVRILQGVVGGVTYPAIIEIWSQWAPVQERSFMGNVAYTGNYIGIISGMLLTGIISVALNWESAFYIFGSVGVLWYICWIFVVKASPSTDPYITNAEKAYILSSIGERTERRKIKHPYKDIFTSAAVWAIVVANFTAMWGSSSLLNLLPLYLTDTFNFELNTTGILSAVPYFAIIGLLFVSGYLADWLQVKNYLTTGQVRRYFNSAAFIIQMIFMMLTAFAHDPAPSMIYITIAVGSNSLSWSGYVVNPLDIAPSHASIIMGLSNSFGTLAGMLSPILMGFIVTDGSREQWQIMFFISAGVYLFGCIFCMIFVRGRLQPWAKIDIQEQEMKISKNFTKQ